MRGFVRVFLNAALLLLAFGVHAAQARVSVDAAGKVFRLDGGGVTYALGVDGEGYLQGVYWGASLPANEAITVQPQRGASSFDTAAAMQPQEFPGQGGGLTSEPGLKVAFADGNRDLVLKYVSHSISGETLTIALKDISRPISVTLTYRLDPETGIIGRSAVVKNDGRDRVRIDQIASAVFNLPSAPDYRLHYLTGRHGAEWVPQEQKLGPATAILESRRGSTGHQNNPWFAIDKETTGEESGPVWFGALAWSGSWRISIGADAMGRVRIAGGYNPFDFSWRLKPGETLETPVFYAGYSGDGMGGASRKMHRFQLSQILPGAPAPRLRPVLYNSWEATSFKVDVAGQVALAERAAKIGVERFVLDDGWFGARHDDKSSLGDWVVDRSKFPDGLKPLIDKVHGLGMEFGLWVEPEMVSPNSDLYRAHPDWVLNFPGRPRTEARNELVLNLARKEVRDYLVQALDKLLTENDVQFVKWDANRNFTEPGWPEMAPEDQQRVYVDYVRNLYSIFAELRRRHPKVEFESCSGGGGRVDLGIMGLTDQVWPSDNTDAFDRLAIQDGFTMAYAPAVMMAWVTDTPSWPSNRTTSLDYRFLSAMQGSLGVGSDLNKWTEADIATASKMIAGYKEIRPLVQRGDLYRLIRPTAKAEENTATLYVAQDRSRAVLFNMLHSSQRSDNPRNVTLKGLDPARIYRIRALAGAAVPRGVPPQASGAFWMQQGIPLSLRGDFQGVALVFEADVPQ